MILRRLLLGCSSMALMLGLTGCSAKVNPTPMEKSVERDRQVSERILNRMDQDAAFADNKNTFQVMTVRGEATIYGVVNNELERSHAEQIASETDGVQSVMSPNETAQSTDASGHHIIKDNVDRNGA